MKETNTFMLFNEMVPIYTDNENHTAYAQHAEVLNVKAAGTNSYNSALKG